jgi:acetyl esterase/lipase
VLDLYRPAGAGPHPLVVWFHGGYWTQGNRNELPPGFRDQLLGAGYAVATVEYRLAELVANKWPVQVRDAKLAVTWLRANAPALAVDPDSVVTSGFSAGGHLALLVAVAPGAPGQSLSAGDPAVQGAFTFGAPVDLQLARSTNPIADAAVRLLLGCGVDGYCDSTQLEPWRYLDAADPPVLAVSGGADVLVPPAHAQRLADAAAEAGYAGLQRSLVPGAGHDELNAVTPAATYLDWLDEVL